MTATTALCIPPPTFQLLGAELLEAAGGRARVRFVPGHDTTNPAGLLQGGILAACLDDVMGPAVFSLGREGFFVTVSMKNGILKCSPAERSTPAGLPKRLGMAIPW